MEYCNLATPIIVEAYLLPGNRQRLAGDGETAGDEEEGEKKGARGGENSSRGANCCWKTAYVVWMPGQRPALALIAPGRGPSVQGLVSQAKHVDVS